MRRTVSAISSTKLKSNSLKAEKAKAGLENPSLAPPAGTKPAIVRFCRWQVTEIVFVLLHAMMLRS